MAQIIAGLYEIQNEIGSGGGGIVYLGRHLRLNKTVVLKADKRTLSTDTELLRREVDMLKGLSHTYIPQVYDFVQENGVVYTVMDYIEGESLDKLLQRNESISQPQVIKWACQLLDALSYLHSQPPYGILHGDIKPANIMLKPNGDICLIDFNIALALGEDGAVKVGFSRGYASPEHYEADEVSTGQTFSQSLPNRLSDKASEERTALLSGLENDEIETALLDDAEATIKLDDKTECLNQSVQKWENSTSGKNSGKKKTVKLDVRSDIYSLGATLYHLVSGCRPVEKAREVSPLGPEVCSRAVADILQKAMAPDADMRYQSAEEMRLAFLNLHKLDKRVVAFKRGAITAAVISATLFLAGGLCTFIGLKQLEQTKEALALAEYSANALAEGDVTGAVEYALDAIPMGTSILDGPITAQAQMALTDALGVYDTTDGFKSNRLLDLPSAPFDIVVSPGDTYFVVVYAYEIAIYDTASQKQIITLPIQSSALADVLFLNDSCIVYAAAEGVTAYDIEKEKILWTADEAVTLALSGDLQTVAAVNGADNRVIIYRSSDGEKITECDLQTRHMGMAVNDVFAKMENTIFALNYAGNILAVSLDNGGLMLYDLEKPKDNIVIYDTSDYYSFQGGFCEEFFAFSAQSENENVFQLIDVEEMISLGGYSSKEAMLLQVAEKGIYLASGNLLVEVDPSTLEEKEVAYTENARILNYYVGRDGVLVASDDHHFSIYDAEANLKVSQSSDWSNDFMVWIGEDVILGNRNEPILRLIKSKDYSEKQILSYDPSYQHDEARISKDKQTIMLFNYQGFQIYDKEGNLLVQQEIPNAESVYDQQFEKTDEESVLKVIWYDGTVCCYSAKDGAVIRTEEIEEPAKDLYEEFYVDGYRIESSLHGAPEVYEADSDKLVATLEEDAYLTYVTQVEDYIITEYIDTTGKRYGYLLNDKFEKLAYLPGLCDCVDGMLVFDDKKGSLRQSPIYSLRQLVDMGESYVIDATT